MQNRILGILLALLTIGVIMLKITPGVKGFSIPDLSLYPFMAGDAISVIAGFAGGHGLFHSLNWGRAMGIFASGVFTFGAVSGIGYGLMIGVPFLFNLLVLTISLVTFMVLANESNKLN